MTCGFKPNADKAANRKCPVTGILTLTITSLKSTTHTHSGRGGEGERGREEREKGRGRRQDVVLSSATTHSTHGTHLNAECTQWIPPHYQSLPLNCWCQHIPFSFCNLSHFPFPFSPCNLSQSASHCLFPYHSSVFVQFISVPSYTQFPPTPQPPHSLTTLHSFHFHTCTLTHQVS